MKISPLRQELIPQVIDLMELGAPYIRPRTYSDYWLYATLFSSTCPVATIDDALAGAVMAFRSQDNPDDVYIQDVMTHPSYRQRGVSKSLIAAVRDQAVSWGAKRLYLTSEPENDAAHAAWPAMGFINQPSDYKVNDIWVTSDFKGPGKDRAVYEQHLT
ncbi:GNAT family N-acetyltransferase [Amycolatopsis sp. cmx-11-32]|uniref:GNAT family N-acetyltransferase n=1 Tax=Amycolatopsis sp. cmx-11-32 TaxID=2785796 RepID=UPI0039E32A51